MAPPPPPRGISALNLPEGLEVSWRPVVGATEYRSVVQQGSTFTYSPWEPQTHYLWGTLTAGVVYNVGAQARNAAGEISTTSTDSNFRWQPGGPFQVTRRVRWDGATYDPSFTGEYGYEVDGLVAGQSYWFQFRVINESGVTEWVTVGPVVPGGTSFVGQFWPRNRWNAPLSGKTIGQVWPRGNW